MLRIGLTGGIGSGKSTVSRIFAVLGIPVYDADSSAKRLMNTSPELKIRIIELFGNKAYKNGALDRGLIASRVFSDKALLSGLNAVIHPAVITDFQKWVAGRESDGFNYVIHESAILFESGLGELVDLTVTVSAPVGLRVARAAERDGSDPEAVMARIANQMDDAERESRADYVIRNDDCDMLVPQVLELDKIFRQ